jgi:molybdate transport system substrate-binding protein
MKKALALITTVVLLSLGLMTGCTSNSSTSQTSDAKLSGHTLQIYCGAGMTDPFQKIADEFTQETGCAVNVTYANAGQIQSQINTSHQGDMFIAGSTGELDPVKNAVTESKSLVKHIPVLAVAAGNPKSIQGLSDLASADVRFVMGDSEAAPIGKIAKKALTDSGIFSKVNVVTTTTTAPQLATAIATGNADATIVWKENCSVTGVEIVKTSELDNYVQTVPAATLGSSQDAEALSKFKAFLDSDTAKKIWASYGYETV